MNPSTISILESCGIFFPEATLESTVDALDDVVADLEKALKHHPDEEVRNNVRMLGRLTSHIIEYVG